jgi:hypothetical protein
MRIAPTITPAMKTPIVLPVVASFCMRGRLVEDVVEVVTGFVVGSVC